MRCRVASSTAAAISNMLIRGHNTGDVPDLFEGAHNGIGEARRNGISLPSTPGREGGRLPPVLPSPASTFDGGNFGVPWAVENIALLTNKELSRSARPPWTRPWRRPRR